MSEVRQHQSSYKGWLYKWTNYLKGYQKRWFVLQNGLLSYYRNQAEMAHTCRGTINLATAFIHTEDSCTIVISNGGTQTFHLKATSEVERQKWITALELAKADAIRMLEPDSDDDIETSTDKNEIQNTLKALNSKLEDLNTCNDLIGKHGSGLQRALSELEHLNSQTEIVSQIKIVNERATMFRITSNAMINACSEYLDLAQTQGRRWQKMLQHEHEQRLKLEEMLEQLAKDQVSLEIKARKSLIRGESQGLSGGSDEEDFQDALDYHDVVTLPEKQGAEKGLHRRSDSDVSGTLITDDQYSTESDIEESELAHDREAHVYTAKAKKGKHKRVSSEDKAEVHSTDNMEDRGTVARVTKPSGQRQRRTMIPPKPNYSLNLWSIMKNCIGQELSKIPMPVNFSEPLSMLQRLMEDLEYSSCLDRAASCEDSTEQMVHVAAFTVSAYSTTTNRSTKPFNPLLGETFECDRMDDLGWRSVAEQVSHHPPSAAICTEGRGWKLWLDFTMGSKFRGKYLQIIPMGIAHLEFEKTGHHYTWRKVTTTVHNIIVGKLWVDNHGEMDIVNHTTKDRCHLKYNAYSYFSREKPRKVTAVVTDAKDTPKWVLTGTWDERMDVAQVLHVDESGKRPTFATGPYRMIWKRNPILPGSEKMYYFTSFAIELNEPEEGVAPTDSRNRPDQRLMEEGNWDEANKVKMQLEEKQRAKRKQREAAAEELAKRGEAFDGGHKPVWFEKQKDPITGNIIHVFNNRYWENKKSQDWSICPDIFI
ncbi:hypothetical protein CHS0354_024397 [Potamilus streckersoni]|uniref:Oxysterol-binding protein n=1 Tax=Potamilus streckersoni TaxID=2493646 RepID=A0AAE0W2I4_9BIVA|nr:hypothetical protein CHS0354_024397 [Potamilus streckersoni]